MFLKTGTQVTNWPDNRMFNDYVPKNIRRTMVLWKFGGLSPFSRVYRYARGCRIPGRSFLVLTVYNFFGSPNHLAACVVANCFYGKTITWGLISRPTTLLMEGPHAPNSGSPNRPKYVFVRRGQFCPTNGLPSFRTCTYPRLLYT